MTALYLLLLFSPNTALSAEGAVDGTLLLLLFLIVIVIIVVEEDHVAVQPQLMCLFYSP